MGNFDAADFVTKLAIYMVVWLFAVSAHEAAHAWMSLKFGDDTAQRLGRVTLNPLPHIDPLGTLVLPIIAFVASYSPSAAGIPLIMWGKPTPVNPLRWRNKDRANVMVSLAGIMVNILIAVVVLIVLKILFTTQVLTQQSINEGLTKPIFMLLWSALFLNVGLAVFNLLPVPPLDGGRALESFLPSGYEGFYQIVETYGFFILLILIYMGVLNYIIGPLNSLILYLLFGI